MGMKNEKSRELSASSSESASGGWYDGNPGAAYEMRYSFNDDEARFLRKNGHPIRPDTAYARSDLAKLLNLKSNDRDSVADFLTDAGLRYQGQDGTMGNWRL